MKPFLLLCSFLTFVSFNQIKTYSGSTATNAMDESQTKAIVEHHFKAFNENDLAAIMADYTEESILISPGGTCNGLSDITKDFEGVFKVFPKDSTTFKIVKVVIKKDVAYVIWTAKTPKFELSFGTDTFIIQKGKIVRHTIAIPRL